MTYFALYLKGHASELLRHGSLNDQAPGKKYPALC